MKKAQPLGLWQLTLMHAYYGNSAIREDTEMDDDPEILDEEADTSFSSGVNQNRRLVSQELLTTAMTKVEQWLQQWQQSKCGRPTSMLYMRQNLLNSNKKFHF